MSELIHAYPTTKQGFMDCLTACEIRSSWTDREPILKRTHNIEEMTCVLCKVAATNQDRIAKMQG